jgi:hypothetical protein
MFLSVAFVALMSIRYRSRNLAILGLVLAGIVLLILTVGLSAILAQCGEDITPERAERILKGNNLKLVRGTGSPWFACGEDDFYSYGFVAINQYGDEVTGVICCGLSKACTVRY